MAKDGGFGGGFLFRQPLSEAQKNILWKIEKNIGKTGWLLDYFYEKALRDIGESDVLNFGKPESQFNAQMKAILAAKLKNFSDKLNQMADKQAAVANEMGKEDHNLDTAASDYIVTYNELSKDPFKQSRCAQKSGSPFKRMKSKIDNLNGAIRFLQDSNGMESLETYNAVVEAYSKLLKNFKDDERDVFFGIEKYIKYEILNRMANGKKLEDIKKDFGGKSGGIGGAISSYISSHYESLLKESDANNGEISISKDTVAAIKKKMGSLRQAEIDAIIALTDIEAKLDSLKIGDDADILRMVSSIESKYPELYLAFLRAGERLMSTGSTIAENVLSAQGMVKCFAKATEKMSGIVNIALKTVAGPRANRFMTYRVKAGIDEEIEKAMKRINKFGVDIDKDIVAKVESFSSFGGGKTPLSKKKFSEKTQENGGAIDGVPMLDMLVEDIGFSQKQLNSIFVALGTNAYDNNVESYIKSNWKTFIKKYIAEFAFFNSVFGYIDHQTGNNKGADFATYYSVGDTFVTPKWLFEKVSDAIIETTRDTSDTALPFLDKAVGFSSKGIKETDMIRIAFLNTRYKGSHITGGSIKVTEAAVRNQQGNSSIRHERDENGRNGLTLSRFMAMKKSAETENAMYNRLKKIKVAIGLKRSNNIINAFAGA